VVGAALLAAGAAGIGVVAAPSHLAAQRYWKQTLYPLPFYSATDGFWFTGHFATWSPVGFVERPEPVLALVSVDAGASTEGSRLLRLDAQAPAWWDGWRVGLTATWARANRLAYHGLGNDSPFFADSLASFPYLYRVSRTTGTLRATVQRRVAGPVRALAGAVVTRSDFRALPGASEFARDAGAGTVDTAALPTTDAAVRIGVVVDMRDTELDPHRGLFAEFLYARGGDYAQRTAVLQAYVQPVEPLTVAVRVAAEDQDATAPLAAQMELQTSEGALPAVGGYRSARAYPEGRFVGPGKLFGGIEARYAVLWRPTLIEIKLVAFYEAGRVFGPGESLRLTTDGLHPSGGVEVAIRWLRNTLLVGGVAFGDEGSEFVFGTTWSF
jgi:hypothetical protein